MSGSHLVILLGAGRSGTTLLYKLLSAHSDIAYLSNYQNRWPAFPVTAVTHRILNFFPKLMGYAWFKPEGGAYFNARRQLLKSLVPTPAEAETVYSNCGMPLNPESDFVLGSRLVTTLQSRFEKIRSYSGSKFLLTKRTANNRRIPELNEIFPEAKYIHLVRDGRAVAYSLPRVSWWDDHVLYWSGESPKEMVAKGAVPIELAAMNWVEEMKSLEVGLSLIENSRVLEVRYEDLLRRPLAEIDRMLEFISIDHHTIPSELRLLVDSLQLRPRQEAWTRLWTDEERQRVVDIQHEQLVRWGYI